MQTFKQYLNEIGDSFKPYGYGPLKIRHFGDFSYECITKFKTGSGDTIMVSMNTAKLRDGITTRIEFRSSERNFAATNAGLSEAFRVVATVIEASVNYLKEINSDGAKTDIVIFSTNADARKSIEKSDQRTKLYLAFVKKKFPGAKIKMSNKGLETEVEIMVPDRFYK